jgi:hypothetical protein
MLSKEDVFGGVEISTGTCYKQIFTQTFRVTKLIISVMCMCVTIDGV